jgi:hypothetical protein
MNAPGNPALLAMPRETRELMLRVAEATRLDAAIAARGDVLSMRQRGHAALAGAHEGAHAAVMNIDVEKLVDEFVPQPPVIEEMAAFEAAAKANHTNILRNAKGEFVHPATQRAYAIWQLAVRWARNQDEPP